VHYGRQKTKKRRRNENARRTENYTLASQAESSRPLRKEQQEADPISECKSSSSSSTNKGNNRSSPPNMSAPSVSEMLSLLTPEYGKKLGLRKKRLHRLRKCIENWRKRRPNTFFAEEKKK